MATFRRPTGAAADLREIEYVSALQQTQKEGGVRRDGSIIDEDISLYLRSRYAVDLPAEEVRRNILPGIGGEEDEEAKIDLAEYVATLLIPTLVKAAAAKNVIDGQDEEGKSELISPNPKLIDQILAMILKEVTGKDDLTEPPELTESLLKEIFQTYGEGSFSENNEELLKEMIAAASPDTIGTESVSAVYVKDDEEKSGGAVFLDTAAFARALTSDLKLYDADDEVRISTNQDDIRAAGETVAERYHNQKHRNAFYSTDQNVRKFYSSAMIDYTACKYDSKEIVVLLWIILILILVNQWFLYPGITVVSAFWTCNENDHPCEFGKSILVWIYKLIVFSLFGLWVVGGGSLGNTSQGRKCPLFLAAISTLAVATFLLVSNLVIYGEEGTPWGYQFLLYLSVAIALAVIILQILLWISFQLQRNFKYTTVSGRFQWFSASPGTKSEARLKKAAAYKLDQLVNNALDVHNNPKCKDANSASLGAALLNFSLQEEQYEEIGGVIWGWKEVLSGRLSTEDGVWFSARVVAGNVAQVIIAIYLLMLFSRWSANIINEYIAISTGPGNTTIYFLNAGFAQIGFSKENFVETVLQLMEVFCYELTNNTNCEFFDVKNATGTIDDLFERYIPTELYMFTTPLVLGTILSFLTSMIIPIFYIPSVISTTLQFRSGVIPFFHDAVNFEKYRKNMDTIPQWLGTMVWATIFPPFCVFFGTVLVVFLLCLPWSQKVINVVLHLIAFLCGIIFAVIIRTIIALFVLRSSFTALYRRKVNQANIASLAIETLNIGLGIYSAILRAVKLALIPLLFVGRIDVPLFDKSRSIPDGTPDAFLRDLIIREAHRHPYIETSGKIFLMKLRYRERFINRAGYWYRLLFALTLLPWLRKYRVMARPELLEEGQNKDDLSRYRKPEEITNKIKERIKELQLMLETNNWEGFITSDSNLLSKLVYDPKAAKSHAAKESLFEI